MDIKALIEEKNAIEAKLAEARKLARDSAITQVLDIMAEHGLSGSDLGFVAPAKAARKPRSSNGAAPKYKDPESGQTWAGRGRRPTWLVNALAGGRSLESFAAQ